MIDQEDVNQWTVNPDTLKQDYDELKEQHETFTKLIAEKFMQMNRGMIKLQAERDQALEKLEYQKDCNAQKVDQLQKELSDSTNHYNGIINGLRAEVARLKDEVQAITCDGFDEHFRPVHVRPEPSRLEIAAMLYKGMLSSGYIWGDPEKTAIRAADALIAAAKEVTK
jgi:hypothetical protein